MFGFVAKQMAEAYLLVRSQRIAVAQESVVVLQKITLALPNILSIEQLHVYCRTVFKLFFTSLKLLGRYYTSILLTGDVVRGKVCKGSVLLVRRYVGKSRSKIAIAY